MLVNVNAEHFWIGLTNKTGSYEWETGHVSGYENFVDHSGQDFQEKNIVWRVQSE